MNRIKTLIGVFAFSLMLLAIPTIASAQWGGNNGGYGNGSYNRNIRGTIQNLKNRSRNFERLTNRIEDRRGDRDDRWGNDDDDRWGNDRRNDRRGNNGNIGRIEDLADRFKRAADDLADEYGSGRNMNNSRDEAQRLLSIGNEIDQELYRTRSNRNLQNEWSRIRQDLNVIAQVYGGGYNNRNRNGNWRNNVPFPLPF